MDLILKESVNEAYEESMSQLKQAEADTNKQLHFDFKLRELEEEHNMTEAFPGLPGTINFVSNIDGFRYYFKSLSLDHGTLSEPRLIPSPNKTTYLLEIRESEQFQVFLEGAEEPKIADDGVEVSEMFMNILICKDGILLHQERINGALLQMEDQTSFCTRGSRSYLWAVEGFLYVIDIDDCSVQKHQIAQASGQPFYISCLDDHNLLLVTLNGVGETPDHCYHLNNVNLATMKINRRVEREFPMPLHTKIVSDEKFIVIAMFDWKDDPETFMPTEVKLRFTVFTHGLLEVNEVASDFPSDPSSCRAFIQDGRLVLVNTYAYNTPYFAFSHVGLLGKPTLRTEAFDKEGSYGKLCLLSDTKLLVALAKETRKHIGLLKLNFV